MRTLQSHRELEPDTVSPARRWAGALLTLAALGLALRAVPQSRSALGALTRATGVRTHLWILLAGGVLGLVLSLGAALAEWRAWRTGRHPDGLAAMLRKAFVALVAAWLWTVFLQPELVFWRALPTLTGAVAAAVFGLARLSAGIPRRHFPWALRRAADLCCTSLCAAAVLGEVGLRAASHVVASPLLARQRDDPGDETLRANRLEPGAPHLGQPTNSGGYNDAEFLVQRPLRRRVVAIGDSFSVGVVPHPFHFTTLAEELLESTEICNMGASSIGPRQYLWLLREEALALEPDLVVINLYAGNDLLEYTPEPVQGTWSMLQRRHVLLYLVATRLRALVRERAGRGSTLDELATGLGGDLEAGLSRSEIARRLPHLERPDLEQPVYSEDFFMQQEVERARLACGESAESYAQLASLLDAICAVAGDTALAVMLIPDEFQVDDRLWSALLERLPGETLERDRFQRRVRELLAERGVPVLDLLAPLRAAAPWEDGLPHLYHLRDTHFNARGNRVTGEALAEFLRPLLR